MPEITVSQDQRSPTGVYVYYLLVLLTSVLALTAYNLISVDFFDYKSLLYWIAGIASVGIVYGLTYSGMNTLYEHANGKVTGTTMQGFGWMIVFSIVAYVGFAFLYTLAISHVDAITYFIALIPAFEFGWIFVIVADFAAYFAIYHVWG